MKVEISKKELISLLGKTQNIVMIKTTMPSLAYVRLEAKQDKIKIYATDLVIMLIDESSAVIQTEGNVVVNAKNFFDIVRELNEGPITLTQLENDWLEIRQGKFISKLPRIPIDLYPSFEIPSGLQFLLMKSKNLSEMVERSIHAISSDSTRPYLTGVNLKKYIHQGDFYIQMTSSDGHRLAQSESPTLTAAPSTATSSKIANSKSDIIIPKKGIHELKKLLEFNDQETVSVAAEEFLMAVKTGPTFLIIRLIDSMYPTFGNFIPQSIKTKFLVKRTDLFSSMKRVSLLMNETTKSILFQIFPGKMEVSTYDSIFGTAKDEIEIDYQGENLKIGFNARYILDVLTVMPDTEIVEIGINEQLTPVLIKPYQNELFKFVIMPMRLSN